MPLVAYASEATYGYDERPSRESGSSESVEVYEVSNPHGQILIKSLNMTQEQSNDPFHEEWDALLSPTDEVSKRCVNVLLGCQTFRLKWVSLSASQGTGLQSRRRPAGDRPGEVRNFYFFYETRPIFFVLARDEEAQDCYDAANDEDRPDIYLLRCLDAFIVDLNNWLLHFQSLQAQLQLMIESSRNGARDH